MGKEHDVDSFSKTSYKISLVDNGIVVIGHVSLRFVKPGVGSIESTVGFGFERDDM